MGKKQSRSRRRQPPAPKKARRYGRRFLLRSVLSVLLLLAILYAKSARPELVEWVKGQMETSMDLSFLQKLP